MSQMFDNYTKEKINIPDNQKIYLKKHPEYKDVLVLGGDNEHTFDMSYSLNELKRLWITYKQGTEVKLTKEYIISEFIPPNDEFSAYIYSDGAKIYELYKDEDLDIKHCVLFYHLDPQESLLFNDYNKNITVQLKVELDPEEANIDCQVEHNIIEYSKEYKIKLINTILKGVAN